MWGVCACGGITFTRAPALSNNSTVETLPSCAATMRGVSLVSVLASTLAPLMHGAGKSNNAGGGGRGARTEYRHFCNFNNNIGLMERMPSHYSYSYRNRLRTAAVAKLSN